jgi:hypothetical protein
MSAYDHSKESDGTHPLDAYRIALVSDCLTPSWRRGRRGDLNVLELDGAKIKRVVVDFDCQDRSAKHTIVTKFSSYLLQSRERTYTFIVWLGKLNVVVADPGPAEVDRIHHEVKYTLGRTWKLTQRSSPSSLRVLSTKIVSIQSILQRPYFLSGGVYLNLPDISWSSQSIRARRWIQIPMGDSDFHTTPFRSTRIHFVCHQPFHYLEYEFLKRRCLTRHIRPEKLHCCSEVLACHFDNQLNTNPVWSSSELIWWVLRIDPYQTSSHSWIRLDRF